MKSIHTFLFIVLMLLHDVIFSAPKSDTTIIQDHLETLTRTFGYRTHDNFEALNQSADYIKDVFEKYSDDVSFQEFRAGAWKYKNVIASFGPMDAERIIIGAHYDVCEEQEGADDNASGVVGLLELARLLKDKELNYRIDLVAYSLEEPPYFRSEFMGSYIHAKSLVDKDIPVKGMICLEMIGYFSEEKKTQKYPIGPLSLIYGRQGNYITVVKKWGAGSFGRQYARKMKKTKDIPVKKFSGPASLPGIDFSDHLNYWKFDFSAVMITDTAFYRNKNYHEKTDTLETLNISKMAMVIDAVLESLLKLK